MASSARPGIAAPMLAVLALAFAQPAARAASPAPVAARHGMVVSAHRLASAAGVDVLRRGGNAIDAAVATAYALAVTYPAAGNLGGGGFMTVRMADGRQTFIDFRETAPAAATATMYQDTGGNVVPGLSTLGHRAVAVPGTVAGLELARANYGTRARATLIAPALALARAGFVLDPGDAETLAEATADFARDPPSAAIFLDHGRARGAGTRLVQPDLARTLQAVSQRGADGFYRGETARRLALASARGGGILTTADLAAYRAVERAPLTCDHRGYHIVSAPPPSSGGVVICQTLAVLSGYPLAALGFHAAQGVHYTVEAWRRAFHDRNLKLGDPAFVRADVAELVSPAYAARARAGISADRATPSVSLPAPGAGREGRSTTHLSVVDAAGNAVALTYTLNNTFGARVTAAGTGVLLNDEMDDFSAKPGAPNMFGLVEGANNAVAPGKRPLSSMAPTIVTHDGRLVLVIGTPGGSHIPTALVQVLVNMIDHGMGLTDAIDAPRIHAQWLPDVLYWERHALSADTRAALAARGHTLEPMEYWNQVAAIAVGAPSLGDRPSGRDRLFGAIDPRLPTGAALGY